MTTITFEVNREEDVKALKAYLTAAGYRFEIEESTVEHSDEFKAMLDQRYEEIQSGKVQMISAEESESRIRELLAGKKQD